MIPDNFADLILTDPPYKTITGGRNNGKNSKRPKGILNNNNGLFKHQKLKISDWMPEIYRILKEGSQCYIFTNTINLEAMLTESRLVGFKLHNVLAWEKNNCPPSQYYMKNCEYVLFLRKGKAKWINDIGGSKTVHKFDNIIGKKIHPCEKPIPLLEFYINNSSEKNDIVFDPFIGSGNTAVAAKNLGRRYLGFEIDEEHYEKALKRIAGEI
jgi:DNA modification methylase